VANARASAISRCSTAWPCGCQSSALSSAIEASVFDIAPEGTQLPIDATGADVCLAVARIGEVRVAASVGERALQNAKTELLACIDQAVHALQPYGVTRADVDAVVRQALQQKANANTK